MRTIGKPNYPEQMQQLFHDFKKDKHGDGPVDLDDLYDWALKLGRWARSRQSARSQFKREMGKALRAERIVDDQGNPVRVNHPVKNAEGTGYLWDDIRTAKPAHMQMSLQARRLTLAAAAVLHDCDTRYYNEHNQYGAQLQFEYNLDPHVEEARQPTEYPDERPKES